MKRKTGPKAARDDCCHINQSGYLRGRFGGKQRLAHVVAWEAVYGPVPYGKQLHHVNEDKLDNRIENLELLTPLEHKRRHSGCEFRDGVWWKPCRMCGSTKPIDADHWYLSKEGYPLYGRCRLCHSRKVCEDDKTRRAKARAARPPPGHGVRSTEILGVIEQIGDATVEQIAATVYGSTEKQMRDRVHALLTVLRDKGIVERDPLRGWRRTMQGRDPNAMEQRVKPADPRQVAMFGGGS